MASTYSTWAFYSGDYGGNLPEETYRRRALDAKLEIDRLTFGRAASAPESMTERLALAECRLVDAINSYREADANTTMAGVTSINNDGYSISMAAVSQQERQNAYRQIALDLLAYPINLLYAGACVRNRGCC